MYRPIWCYVIIHYNTFFSSFGDLLHYFYGKVVVKIYIFIEKVNNSFFNIQTKITFTCILFRSYGCTIKYKLCVHCKSYTLTHVSAFAKKVYFHGNQHCSTNAAD